VEWKHDDRPLFLVLVDMVGKRDAVFYWEANSREQSPNIVDVVWEEARELGVRNFRNETKYRVYDDHIPFLNAGIPAVDVIDFGFPEWHTLRDTPDVCDPASLDAVGSVLLSLSTRAAFLSH
jgi:hypothetical protein